MIHIEFARRGLSILSHCGSWGRADGRASFAPPARILRGDLGRLAGLVGLDCDPDAHFLAQSGLDRLDLAAPGALAGSFWLLCALLGAPAGSIWLPTITPSTRLAKKKRFAYRRSCFDTACFVRSGTFLHASYLVLLYRPNGG